MWPSRLVLLLCVTILLSSFSASSRRVEGASGGTCRTNVNDDRVRQLWSLLLSRCPAMRSSGTLGDESSINVYEIPRPPRSLGIHTPCLKFGRGCPHSYVRFLEALLRDNGCLESGDDVDRSNTGALSQSPETLESNGDQLGYISSEVRGESTGSFREGVQRTSNDESTFFLKDATPPPPTSSEPFSSPTFPFHVNPRWSYADTLQLENLRLLAAVLERKIYNVTGHPAISHAFVQSWLKQEEQEQQQQRHTGGASGSGAGNDCSSSSALTGSRMECTHYMDDVPTPWRCRLVYDLPRYAINLFLQVDKRMMLGLSLVDWMLWVLLPSACATYLGVMLVCEQWPEGVLEYMVAGPSCSFSSLEKQAGEVTEDIRAGGGMDDKLSLSSKVDGVDHCKSSGSGANICENDAKKASFSFLSTSSPQQVPTAAAGVAPCPEDNGKDDDEEVMAITTTTEAAATAATLLSMVASQSLREEERRAALHAAEQQRLIVAVRFSLLDLQEAQRVPLVIVKVRVVACAAAVFILAHSLYLCGVELFSSNNGAATASLLSVTAIVRSFVPWVPSWYEVMAAFTFMLSLLLIAVRMTVDAYQDLSVLRFECAIKQQALLEQAVAPESE